jgi:hypothetical protein
MSIYEKKHIKIYVYKIKKREIQKRMKFKKNKILYLKVFKHLIFFKKNCIILDLEVLTLFSGGRNENSGSDK